MLGVVKTRKHRGIRFNMEHVEALLCFVVYGTCRDAVEQLPPQSQTLLLGKPRLRCSRRISERMLEQQEQHATACLDVVRKDMLIATAKLLPRLQMSIDHHVNACRTRRNGSEWISFAAVEDGVHGD